MGLAFISTAAFGLWLILWALGIKGFDGFLVAALIILVAAGVRYLGQFMPWAQASDDV
ncbi:MAG: hypothetical protein JWQ48_1621 [Conexibacter sp.]|jgi:hypothetical protein|nr:hypothetical protein [Conexibacter sp.]